MNDEFQHRLLQTPTLLNDAMKYGTMNRAWQGTMIVALMPVTK